MFTQDMSNHVQTLAEHQLLHDMLYFHESGNLCYQEGTGKQHMLCDTNMRYVVTNRHGNVYIYMYLYTYV